MPTRSSPKGEAPRPRGAAGAAPASTAAAASGEAPRALLLRAGTSGWSYDAWKGPFYPPDLTAGAMLRFYAEKLPAVEVNNTFYRMPKPAVLEGWASQTPASFRFALKASRRITHLKRLREVEDETAYLLRTAAALGERLGALLFQLPPNLKLDLARLDAFLALLPEATRAAFEFRHPSWSDGAVLSRLRARGFAFVVADVNDAPAPECVATAPWIYLRLRRAGYARDDLATWLERVRASGASEAFVFFKHEDEGAAARMAAELLELAEPAAPLRARPAAERGRETA
jgi:uncharacterized protein YecE (DUF72 family)